MDALMIREADCLRVDGGWFVRVDCCSSFVADVDADKLYKTRELAMDRIHEIINAGDFGDE